MRKIATVKNNHPTIKQVMIYESADGIYVFPFVSLEDGSAIGDEWYHSLNEANAICENEYGINATDWTYIADPIEGCQHDWIAPVRIKGRDTDKSEWGHFEKLEDGVWKEFSLNK
jgi:biofilm protein TabA